MSTPSRSLQGMLLLACTLLSISANASAPSKHVVKPTAGEKMPFTIKRGDCELTIAGKAKIESYLQPHITMLNNMIPDQPGYFKETVDLNFDVAYGKEKYDHAAAEFYFNMRHKGVWGKAVSYANKDSGPGGPAGVRLSETVFGSHTHVSGKPLIWFTDAWLSLSLNAALGIENEKVHTVKMGWFPFEIGRGIALGSAYGLNKEGLGLYSYSEDKGAPGILVHGDIVKDTLSYDAYFSRFEERNYNMGDSFSMVKRHWVDNIKTGHFWRGINQDDDLFAGRIKWQALKDSKSLGTLSVEPYVFYNNAKDQVVSMIPDCDAKWGSYGLSFDHAWNNLEFGGEVALNYGTQSMANIDQNLTTIKRDDTTGNLVEQYTHILLAGGTPAPVTTASKAAAQTLLPSEVYTGNAAIPGTNAFLSKEGRYRPAYKNTFDGWMGVVDMAYKIKAAHLKLAAMYAYASGDVDPNTNFVDKSYKGFIGLHEVYSGTRVKSVIFLDDRSTCRPSSLGANITNPTVAQNTTFTDMQMFGLGATWTPKCGLKDLSINPNMIGFWKVHSGYKYIATPTDPIDSGHSSSTDVARSFMGTELNLITKFTAVKDFSVFVKAALFAPGAFYSDMRGVPLNGDSLILIESDPRNNITDAVQFRLGTDTAYHLNVGVEFKF